MEENSNQISEWLQLGFTHSQILAELKSKNIVVSDRTLRRYISNNGLNRIKISETSHLWLEHVRSLVSMNVPAAQVCNILQTVYNCKISVSSLRRILKDNDISYRSNMPDEEIVDFVRENNTGLLGCRMMTTRLRLLTGSNISRHKVQEVLRQIDPEGVAERTRRKLHRRTYNVPGPNYMWHMDGHDQLSKYGFPIHGCTDGYSRKFIWLALVKNNRTKNTVLKLYRDAVVELNGLPVIIRSDGGTENLGVAELQIGAYGEDAFIFGSSTRNTRIEGAWRQMRDRCTDLWMQAFESLVSNQYYNLNDDYHVFLAQLVFTDLILTDLNLYLQTWNQHRIRKDPKYGTDGGVPDVLYYHSCESCLLQMPNGFVELLNESIVQEESADVFDTVGAAEFLRVNGFHPITKQNMLDAFVTIVGHFPPFLITE